MNIENGELLAVKTYKFSEDPDKVKKEFISMRKEIRLLNDLDHPNIVKYIQTDLSEGANSIDVVIEYVSGGSLKLILQKY
jgi:serine/threonine protein kinase